ncbi:hypothetical protein [Ectobacillus ponti]|uniref:Uncharacterized protein n=1 Tax=Ectobacillus ponti TaxID=2961894 RepID=A0AA41X844_9BACI|nr:hypothetical protein [Ectobacillus ponti]MCP8968033.1 hypothetical protein [Ectobacillus ponti]
MQPAALRMHWSFGEWEGYACNCQKVHAAGRLFILCGSVLFLIGPAMAAILAYEDLQKKPADAAVH